MLTYEYKCKECGVQFEKLQTISEAPIQECPECGGRLIRLLNPGGGLLLKGNGFYSTDYAGRNKTDCHREHTCCGRENPCGKSCSSKN